MTRWKITVFGVDGDVQVFEVFFDKLGFLKHADIFNLFL